MATRKVLDDRVSGTQCEVPQHPRVEPLTVASVLKKRPSELYWLTGDASVLDALKVMTEHDVGAVLVLESGGMCGIFSEHDYARNSVRAGVSPATALREAMSPGDFAVNVSDSVPECLKLMVEHRERYLPVRDAGKLVALLAFDDLLSETIAYVERVFKEHQVDQRIAFLRGTYSC